MSWEVEYTDKFEEWWNCLTEGEQDAIAVVVGLLENKGPYLPFPYSSGIATSRHAHMRELRIQYRGHPYRLLYAFDPRRIALLLLGGCKVGNDRWYVENVPIADSLYDEQLKTLESEEKRNG